MKRLLQIFPLLKKRSFYLFAAGIVLITALTGLLYLPESRTVPLTFEEEEEALREALSLAEAETEKAFYDSALKFRLSPWSSYFASEGLSLYAHLLTEGSDPEAVTRLEGILRDRDKTALYEFCKEKGFAIDRRLLNAEDGPESAGKNSLLYDLELLEKSLSSDKDYYFATEKALSRGDRTLFESLLKQKETALMTGNYNPVPANRETLASAEELTACLLTVLLLAVAGSAVRERKKEAVGALLFQLALWVLLLSAVLTAVTALRARGTIQPEPMQWGGTLPFFPALFLRLFSRAAGSLPLMLLCLWVPRKKAGTWKLFALLPPCRLLLQNAMLFLPRKTASLFSAGSLCDLIFPVLSTYSQRGAAPWAGLFLWLCAVGAMLFLLLKKEQKLSAAKQKLSLENESEL